MGKITWRTRFTELVGCKYPIQQAGMGAVASSELAAAVTEAGGLGMLGGEGLSLALLEAALARVHDLTSGSFGVNFIVPFLDDLETVRLAASRCRVVEFFYGTPDPMFIKIVHDAKAIAAWQVGSAAEARLAADVGCDFIVAQGVEAGGHLRGQLGLIALLNEVLDAVGIPVLAAGGIGTGRALAAALAAGASGVRMGTRFVAAAESNAHPVYVQSLIDAAASDTIVTDVFSANWRDAPHRVLRSCVAAAQSISEPVIGETDGRPVGRFSGAEPLRSTSGRIDAMCLYAGESVDGVRRVQRASDIINEILDEAESGATRRLGHVYIEEARRRLATCHQRIIHCLNQLDDAQIWWRPKESMNCIANLVLHLCGNLEQWIVSGVGGALDLRNRPREFSERTPIPKEQLSQRLSSTVSRADEVLAQVNDAKLLEPRRIQGFEETVLSAVFESLAHFNGHTQEIVYITRLQLGDAYRFAWIPSTAEQIASRSSEDARYDPPPPNL